MAEKDRVIQTFRICQANGSGICNRPEQLLSQCGKSDNGELNGCPIAIAHLRRTVTKEAHGGIDVELRVVRPNKIVAVQVFNENSRYWTVERGEL